MPWDGVGKRPERQPHLRTRARRGRRKGQEKDGQLWQAGGIMEREEISGRPRSGVMEMLAGERPDVGGGVTEHGHGVVVIFA